VPTATGTTEEASFVRLDEYEPGVEPRVRRVVADNLGVTLDLTAEVSLTDDLAADSLDVLELALVLEEIAEDARRTGCVWLEVAPRGDWPGLGAVWEECARLAARGISVNFRLVDEAAFRWRGATERAA
jgi:hypothetical protein